MTRRHSRVHLSLAVCLALANALTVTDFGADQALAQSAGESGFEMETHG